MDLCFIDIETTGSIFGHHEIIEIGVIRSDPNASEVKALWDTRVRPLFPERITEVAQCLNEFRAEEWKDARCNSGELWREFSEFVRGCVPVCHNPSFERAFISLSAAEKGVLDLGLDYHWIGTESLGWPLYQHGFIEKLSLDTLCTFLGVGAEPRPHNALDGARACWRVYGALMHRYEALSLLRKVEVRPQGSVEPAHFAKQPRATPKASS